MMKNFYPDRYFNMKDNIPFQKYYDKGYRSIIFDIDNTLVPHNAPSNSEVVEFIDRLKHMGFSICLLSNNDKQRVSNFNRDLNVNYIYKAMKPFASGYKKAMNAMGTKPSNTIFVGDQIFTDIWGAKRLGIFSILLEPINSKEEFQIILKRIPEKIIKSSYRKQKGLGKYDFEREF